MSLIPRSLSGVFCDDIREEVLGKRSLIGCYGSNMIVSEFPVTLPKLCISAILQTPGDRPFRAVHVMVLKDEETLAEGDLPLEGKFDHITNEFNLATQVLRADVQFVFSPMRIEAPCTLKVRANLDGEEVRGLALTVELATPPNESVAAS